MIDYQQYQIGNCMRRHIMVFVLLFLLGGGVASAQKEYNIWYFGEEGGGIDFNGQLPVVLNDGKTSAEEGCASVCDRRTGTLLFYTDGYTVWNRFHQVMPSGIKLKGFTTATQSALIVPVLGDSMRYYLFTNASHSSPLTSGIGLNYSIVDMRLDSGRGDLEVRDVPLIDTTSEKLCGVRSCNGRDYWVIAHSVGDFLIGDNKFYAFRVTDKGVDSSPVVSIVGSPVTPQNSRGYLKASPNGRMLAMALEGDGVVELFRFDNATGIVSDPIPLRSTATKSLGYGQSYGTSFSPDNTKLYTTQAYLNDTVPGGEEYGLFQFDVSVYDSTVIASSRMLIKTQLNSKAMQIGPDGSIYICRGMQLMVILYPNRRGNACQYQSGLVVPCLEGLPNLIDGYIGGERTEFLPSAGKDATICAGDSVRLEGSGGSTYHWYPNAGLSCTNCATPNASPTSTTTYYVEVGNSGGCSAVDSVIVEVRTPPTADAGESQVICRGDSTQLQGSGGVQFQWKPAAGLSCTNCSDPIARPSPT
jgi:hypothetical protein